MQDTTEVRLKEITDDEVLLDAATVVHDALQMARVLLDVCQVRETDMLDVARLILDEHNRESYIDDDEEEVES